MCDRHVRDLADSELMGSKTHACVEVQLNPLTLQNLHSLQAILAKAKD